MPESPVLTAIGVSRSFRIGRQHIHVLRNIHLEIHRGESVFLCGASGAGKTTLLYTLAGLETPESGEVLFEDSSLYQLPGSRLSALRNSRMGFVFQSYFLLPELTALENVLLPALIAGKSYRPKSSALDRAKELLSRTGLHNRMHHLPSELSGGEQQRVAIARALINDPSVIFADEPTGNLDSKNGAAIIELLLRLVAEERRTLLVVTHDPAIAQKGQRVLRVADGQITPSP